MKKIFKKQLENIELIIKNLNNDDFQKKLDDATKIIIDALLQNYPLLVCGNGGSAADSQHIAGELVGKFYKDRRALNVRALNTDTSIITAWANDMSYETIFSRQVEAYGEVGGVLWVLSTSGNSENIIQASKKAKEMGMKVIGLTGKGGGKLVETADVLITVPTQDTPRIQELHTMIYHYICEEIERNI